MRDNLGKEITEPPAPKVPDPNCKHMNFRAQVACHRLSKSDSPNAVANRFTAEIIVTCEECGGNFEFEGLPWMISIQHPCVNTSRTEVSIPMKPWDGLLTAGTCKVVIPS